MKHRSFVTLFLSLVYTFFVLFSFIDASYADSPDEDLSHIQDLEDNLDKNRREVEKFMGMIEAMGLKPEELSEDNLDKLVESFAKGDSVDFFEGDFIDLFRGNAEGKTRLVIRPFQDLSEDDVYQIFYDLPSALPNLPLVGFIRPVFESKKMASFFVKALRDDHALPAFASILDDRTKLLIFFLVNIFIFIFNLFYRRYQNIKNAQFGFFTYLITWVKRALMIISLRFVLLVLFFGTQLYPLFKIGLDSFWFN